MRDARFVLRVRVGERVVGFLGFDGEDGVVWQGWGSGL